MINKILQNTACPSGFWGRMMLRGMNRFHTSLAEWAMSQTEWQEPRTLLDIGCGGGALLARLLERFPGSTVHGIDISAESVAFASRRNRKWMGSRCFIRQGEARSLPYEPESFDAVTAFETIYFWQDLPASFGEVARILRAGGLFLIACEVSDPGNDTWTSRIEGMRVYSPEEIQTRLEEAGFTDIRICRRNGEEVCLAAHKAGK